MQSFMSVGPLVPEKKIFEGFFTIYGHGGQVGHANLEFNLHFFITITCIYALLYELS